METNIGKSDNNIANLNKDTTTPSRDPRTELHSAIDKASEKMPAAVDRLANQAHQGLDKVADTIEGMGETFDQKRENIAVAYKRFAESGRSYVRKSPAVSVLVALAAGYAVSKLFGARKH
jgi:ElaB protein